MFSEYALTLNYHVKETFKPFFFNLFDLNKYMNLSRFFKFEYLGPLPFLFIKQIVIRR